MLRQFMTGMSAVGHQSILSTLWSVFLLWLPIATCVQWLALVALAPSWRKSLFAWTLFGCTFGAIVAYTLSNGGGDGGDYGGVFCSFVLGNALCESVLRSHVAEGYAPSAPMLGRQRVQKLLWGIDMFLKSMIVWMITA